MRLADLPIHVPAGPDTRRALNIVTPLLISSSEPDNSPRLIDRRAIGAAYNVIVSETWTFAALIICAAGLGAATLSALRLPRDNNWEFVALSVAAGLGLLGVVLGVFGLVGVLQWARWLIPIGAVSSLAWFIRGWRHTENPKLQRPSFFTVAAILILASVCLGAIAPVTESDSLAYPIPIAEQLARDGHWQFWPHLARSVYPLSQQFLEAALIVSGNHRVGLISAAEFVVATVLIAMLAIRILARPAAGWVASIIALGCPAVAFLVGSAKEDLLLIVMTVAGAYALNLKPGKASVAAAGLFAGLAAGAKYTGLPIAFAIVVCVPFCCGQHRRYPSLALAALIALAAGGLWYGVNFMRFGNPVVPLMHSIGHFPVSAETAAEWIGGFGYGRKPIDFVLAPFRMGVEVLTFTVGEFGGRGNWINPLAFLGVPWALLNRRRWSAFMPLLVISLALYITWFSGTQVSRLLLPALALLAIPTADALLWAWSRSRIVRYPIGFMLAISAGIVISVGVLRFARYVSDPAGFLDHETEHFAAIQWMNTHLDPTRDRVATDLRSSGYLRIPWMNLAGDYQVEISADDEADPSRLRAALKRQGFTYVFGLPEAFDEPPAWLVPVYTDPDSRLGGAHFFRSQPTESVTVFEVK